MCGRLWSRSVCVVGFGRGKPAERLIERDSRGERAVGARRLHVEGFARFRRQKLLFPPGSSPVPASTPAKSPLSSRRSTSDQAIPRSPIPCPPEDIRMGREKCSFEVIGDMGGPAKVHLRLVRVSADARTRVSLSRRLWVNISHLFGALSLGDGTLIEIMPSCRSNARKCSSIFSRLPGEAARDADSPVLTNF